MPRAARSVRVRDPNTGAEYRLTPKEYEFAKLLVTQGLSQEAAYRQAYKNKSSDKSCRVTGHVLANKHDIRLTQDVLRDQMERPALRDAESTRRLVLSILHQEATGAESARDRLRAAELLGRVQSVGLFLDRKEIIHKREAGPGTSGELLSKLRSLVSSQVIDATPLRMESEATAEASVIPADQELSTG